jgi:hypothetical protein
MNPRQTFLRLLHSEQQILPILLVSGFCFYLGDVCRNLLFFIRTTFDTSGDASNSCLPEEWLEALIAGRVKHPYKQRISRQQIRAWK